MRQHSFRERLSYEFDKSMAAGPIALIGWLGIACFLIIIAAATFITIIGITPAGADGMSFLEAFWESLMRTFDPGTMGGDQGWGFRGVSLVVTLAGIFVFSALIGVLNSGLESKLDELRKGRSRVLEEDQTVILNWSPSIFDIISELVIANASRKRPSIVIMATKDKVEMEDEIKAKVPELNNTRVICRSGDPTDLYDLDIVNPQTCRSVIVLSPEGDDPDSQVIKSVLALVNDPKRRKDPYQIAAEIRDAANVDVARAVGGDEMQLILADDLISRIVVHSSRQSGLSGVYSELLDFDGCEIYTAEQPAITGKTFGDIVSAYDTSTPIGLCDETGKITLNPSMETVVKGTDRLVIISEDDASIKVSGSNPEIDESAILEPKPRVSLPERTLILGWNRRGPIIAHELSRYVAAGSELVIAADTPELRDENREALTIHGDNLKVVFQIIDTSNRQNLDSLDIPSFNHVLVLGYSDHFAAQPADTRTLITLLHIRKIAEKAGRHISVVSEMIDVRNRELAEVTRADDFVVSNKLVSLMLAQASENRSMAAIFDDLLDEEGSEIYMRPAGDYVPLGKPVNFHTVTEAAKRRGEVALGHRMVRSGSKDPRNLGGVIINPTKTEAVNYIETDRIIVLAQD